MCRVKRCWSRVCVLLAVISSYCSALTSEEALRKMLLDPLVYNPEALPLPRPGHSKPQISLTYYLLNLHHVLEKRRVLTTYGRIKAEWYDLRLTWNPAHYGNISRMLLSPNRLWTPELAVVNAETHMFLDFTRFLIVLRSNGHVTWTPAGLFETQCDVDVTLYPYDYQKCFIQVGTWAMTTDDILLTNAKPEIQLDQYSEHGAWDILETSVKTEVFQRDADTGQQYQCVSFYLVMERIHAFYSIHLVLPSAAMAILVPMIFMTPAGSGEKITLGVSVVLAFSVFLLFAVDNLPESSRKLPVMGICLMFIMIISSSALALSILNLNLHHRPNSRPISRGLRWFTFAFLARVFCIQVKDLDQEPQPQGVGRASPNAVTDITQRQPPQGEAQKPPNTAQKKPRMSTPRLIKVNTMMQMTEHMTEESEVGDVMGVLPEKGGSQWELVARIMDRFFFAMTLGAMILMFLALMIMVNSQTVPTLSKGLP